MKLQKFSQFISENHEANMDRLRQLGILAPVAPVIYQRLVDETDVDGYIEVNENLIIFNIDWQLDADTFGHSWQELNKIDINDYDFSGIIQIVLDFDKMEIRTWSTIEQPEIEFEEDYSDSGPMFSYIKGLNDYYGKDSTKPTTTAELGDQLVKMFLVWNWQEDPFRIWHNIRHIIEVDLNKRFSEL